MSLIAQVFHKFVKFAPLWLVFSLVYAAAGGYLLWLVDRHMSLAEAYARHVEFFFSIRSPVGLCRAGSRVVAFVSLVSGWLFIPTLVSMIVAEAQQQLLEERLAERKLRLAILETIPEHVPNRENMANDLFKKVRKILLGGKG